MVFRGGGLLFWWVDPGGGWQLGWLRGFALEAVWVGQERDVEGVGRVAGRGFVRGRSERSRGHEADAGVAVGAVVPLEELLAVGARILDAAEALREVGSVFERFELRLGIRIVIGDVGPAVGLGDLQIDQQGGHRFAAHAGAAIGVQGERARSDVMFGNRIGDQLFGKLGGFTQRDHPAHDVAAEDIEDHVQVIAAPFDRAFELRDVPAPDLVGLHRQQLRFGVGRMDTLIAPLARLAFGPRAAGTWCAPSPGSGPRRAAWRRRCAGRSRQSVRCRAHRSSPWRSGALSARGARGRGVGCLGEISRRRRGHLGDRSRTG